MGLPEVRARLDADDLLQGGHEVDLVAPSEQVMPGLLPLQAAEAVKRGLEGIGARFHLGATLERLQRSRRLPHIDQLLGAL